MEELKPIVNTCGLNLPPGTRAELFLCPTGEFNGWPQTREEVVLGAAGTPAQGDKMILDEPFVFVTTTGLGYFRKYTIVTDSGNVTDTLVGEVGGRSWENTLAFKIAGTKAEQLEFASLVANACLVALIATRTDDVRVVGRNNDPAFVESIEITTGNKAGDGSGGTYLLKSSAGQPAMIYDAETHGINETPNA